MKHIISKLAAAALLLPGIAGWGAEPFRLGACFHFGSSASGDVEANLNLFEQAGLNAGRDGAAGGSWNGKKENCVISETATSNG